MFHLETFTITQEQAHAATLHQFVKNPLRSAPAPGEYLRLIERPDGTPPSTSSFTMGWGDTLWMSNTPQEQEDHQTLYDNAPHKGTLLIAGMGVCMSLTRILETRPDLNVIQVEKSREVIDLNRAHPTNSKVLRDPRVTVVHADINKLDPKEYPEVTACWFDIWPDICPDNLHEMLSLVKAWNPDRVLEFCGCWSLDAIRELL